VNEGERDLFDILGTDQGYHVSISRKEDIHHLSPIKKRTYFIFLKNAQTDKK
jgi:hypothetical protein